jgi:hypothetical protein
LAIFATPEGPRQTPSAIAGPPKDRKIPPRSKKYRVYATFGKILGKFLSVCLSSAVDRRIVKD